MSATPGNKSSSVTKTLFTGMAQLLEAKKDFNFDLKRASDVVQLTNDILQIFHEIESSTNNQKYAKSIEAGFIISNVFGLPKQNGPADLGTKNKFFTYFLLSTSGEEFHNMLLKFFHEFDNDKDYVISQFEFKEMLNFFCKKEHIGREKIEKVFKKLFPANFKSWYKLDKILDRNEDHELGLNLSNGVFQQMKCSDKQSYAYLQNKKPVVEYIKLLPLFTALYSQLISVRINKRKENLEMTRGVDDLGAKIKLSESSLCDKFERLGLVYDRDDPVILTYRDIENALILFKNYYTSNFGQQQLDLVLSDVQQKYRYSKKRGDFIKPPLFDQKFLTYLAFKVSIHGICHFIKNNQAQMDQYPIIQEFVYWNIVIHADKFDREKLAKKFMSFAKKNPTKEKLDEVFSLFIVKIIPLIPRQIGQNVLNNYLNACGGHINFQDFANRLYDLLVEQAELKLQNYLEMTFTRISQQNDQFMKTETNRRASVFNSGKHGSKPSQDSNIMTRVNPSVFNVNAQYQDHSYVAGGHDYNQNDVSSYNHITHKPSVMTAYRGDVERELMRGPTDQDRSQMYSRSGIKPSEIPSLSDINGRHDPTKLSKIPLLDNLEPPRDSFQFERRSARDIKSANKSVNKSVINQNPNQSHSHSIILTDRDREREVRPTTREPLQQDYLNSCFIMETFLHNFLYEKTFAANNSNKKPQKKETAASHRMSVYGGSKRNSRRMTRLSESINSINQESEGQQESPQTSPERQSSSFFKNYGQQDPGYQQPGQQEADPNLRFRKTRMPTTQFKKKRDSFDELRNEFGDVENFNSDQIFFTKKDMQKKQKGRCACGMEACNIF